MDIVGKRNWYFALSLLAILPGIIALFMWGLRLGIDFTGGTLTEIRFNAQVDKAKITQELQSAGFTATAQDTSTNSYVIRTKPLSDEEAKKLQNTLDQKVADAQILRVETVGPTVGQELLKNSLIGLVVASLAIVIYIAFSFRKVPRPASSWRFGICAVIALIHDALFVVGLFAILGHYFNVEIDSLFMTALLTVIGFSVHDTIVVFDRIRENLLKVNAPFAQIANMSIVQTIVRSLGTSLTLVFVLVALLLFGGTPIRWFVVCLLVGVIAGTYSSIFNAASLLVTWQDLVERRLATKK